LAGKLDEGAGAGLTLGAMETFGPSELLSCYASGVFPMADARDDDRLFLVDPEQRGVLPLAGLHVPQRLARTVRSDLYEVRFDSDFPQVVALCAEPRPDHPETWINRPIERLYGELHALGFAHSVECWSGGRLVGGLYGVSLGGAFFGESMFSRARDASKVALVHLVARLLERGFTLLDAQFMTEHLRQFGAEEIPRRDYRRRLKAALAINARFDDQPIGSSEGGGAATGGATGAGAASTGGATAGRGAGRTGATDGVAGLTGAGGVVSAATGAGGGAAGLGAGIALGAGVAALQRISQAS
jgi:leucyl/phenylalanyl-tRNA--protein transferase